VVKGTFFSTKQLKITWTSLRVKKPVSFNF